MKSKCCNKPLRLSRENPEPGETMYYICDGCNQPADPKCDHSDENELTGEQLHADDYVDKNYPDEREVGRITCSCNDFKETKWCKHMPDGAVKTGWNKPQLSAEMEKRLKNCDGYQCDSCYGTGKDQKLAIDNGIDIDCQKCGGSGVTELAREVRNFLATALEEQKQELLSEIKNRKATIKWLWGKQKTDDECFLMVMEQVQRIAEFAKLNQLKGGKC